MKKFLIVFGTFWLVGFLLGMYVATLQNNEMKSAGEFISYINKNRKPFYPQGELSHIEVPLCEYNYVYDYKNDSVPPPSVNTTYRAPNKLGFGEISATGLMEGLGILGIVSLPTLRQNAYTIVKSDWRFSVLGFVGGGVGFGLGYYLKHKSVCNADNKAFVAFIQDKNNWHSYVKDMPKRAIIIGNLPRVNSAAIK